MLSRRKFISSSAIALGLLMGGTFASPVMSASRRMHVYKSPWCGCCGAWVEHIVANGFEVDVTEMDDVTPVKNSYGINAELHSCHTAVIDGYVIEGHVPASDIERLILERPDAKGLAVPGMPIGSPGMEQGGRRDPFNVVIFNEDRIAVFSRYSGA